MTPCFPNWHLHLGHADRCRLACFYIVFASVLSFSVDLFLSSTAVVMSLSIWGGEEEACDSWLCCVYNIHHISSANSYADTWMDLYTGTGRPMVLKINQQMNSLQLGCLKNKIKANAVRMLSSKSALQQCDCSNCCVGKQLSIIVLSEEGLTTVFQHIHYYGQVGN